MYKRIITYNFDNDDTRDAFVDFLVALEFEEQPDQSTYAQKERNPRSLDALKDAITDWSRDKELSADDSVQIYFLTRISERQTLIDRYNMNYNARHKDIR